MTDGRTEGGTGVQNKRHTQTTSEPDKTGHIPSHPPRHTVRAGRERCRTRTAGSGGRNKTACFVLPFRGRFRSRVAHATEDGGWLKQPEEAFDRTGVDNRHGGRSTALRHDPCASLSLPSVPLSYAHHQTLAGTRMTPPSQTTASPDSLPTLRPNGSSSTHGTSSQQK